MNNKEYFFFTIHNSFINYSLKSESRIKKAGRSCYQVGRNTSCQIKYDRDLELNRKHSKLVFTYKYRAGQRTQRIRKFVSLYTK